MSDQSSGAIKRVNPPELGVPPGYSQVVEVRGGRIIFIAGQTALDRNGNIVGKSNFARQAAQVFEKLERCAAIRRLHGRQFDQADGVSPQHGRFVGVPRSPESIFCH
jgi:hypothetical protein